MARLLDRIVLEGSPTEMGEQHGELLRDEIRALGDERVALITEAHRGASLSLVEELSRSVEAEIARQMPAVYEESKAVANAAGMDYWRLLIAGGYSDVDDLVARSCGEMGVPAHECTLIPVRDQSGKVLLAGTWDSHASAEPFLTLVERRPQQAPNTLALSTAGWPMQQGVSSRGFAFAVANLVAAVGHAGSTYIAALPHIMGQAGLRQAQGAATQLTLCSARFYALTSADSYIGIETDGYDYWTDASFDVHTNHFVVPDAREAEGRSNTASETRRQSAVSLLTQADSFDPETLLELLAYNDDTDASVSRFGTGRDTRTCAAFVLDGQTRELTVTVGPPRCRRDAHRYSIRP